MRKIVLSLLLLMCLLLPASALADTFTFAEQGASCTLPNGTYTIITPDNVAGKTAWLTAKNTTADAVRADFAARGVLLQAWNKDGDVCIEISAVQDQYAQQYYDVNQVNPEERKNYRVGHSSDKTGEWRAQGYDYTSAEWKIYKKSGRFLQLKYTRTVNGSTYRGYARKTIRNGWHIHVDYQVYGRGLKNNDSSALETIMSSWEFIEVTARPATSATKVIFTATPPVETNSAKFTLAGTGSTGLTINAVAMRMTTREVQTYTAVIDSKGKFTLPVTLPREGSWLITYEVLASDNTTVEEGAFDLITYAKDLLTVQLNSALPATMKLTGNSLTISGTTMPKTQVQCIVDGRYDKFITTNNSGEFSFTFDTKDEGVYIITLKFQKKNYDDRRFRCEAVRELTEEDRKQNIRDEAIDPAYKTLTSKMTGYRGRYMVYTLNIKEVSPTSTGYLTFAGMTKTKSGVYKELVAIRTTEKPSWSVGDSVHMYLKCLGSYEVTGSDGTKYYPYFDLQWVE